MSERQAALGVQYSFVQSVKLDESTEDNVNELRIGGGNVTVNESYLEFCVPGRQAGTQAGRQSDGRTDMEVN